MIEDVETGRLIATDVRPVEADDLLRLGPGWRFDWRAAVEGIEVFKLIDPGAPDAIQGLLALKRHKNYVEVTLLESHPQNVGRTKRFRGIPGCLFAFAARLSIEIGGEGFIAIDAKTELIEHYQLSFRTSAFDFPRISLGAKSRGRPSFPCSVLTLSRTGSTLESDRGGPPAPVPQLPACAA